jgi:hypothetical protein
MPIERQKGTDRKGEQKKGKWREENKGRMRKKGSSGRYK